MIIKFNKMSFFLGESIPAEVSYTNDKGEKIVIENPAKSLNVTMHLLDSSNGEDLNYTLGKIEVTVMDKTADQYAKSLPAKEMLTIEPNSSITFTTDLNERLYLRPGDFVCYLQEGEKESNRISISVKYKRESVVPLIQIARDSNMVYGRREWAGDWLRKLHPGFQLDLPYDEDTPDVRKEKEKQISLKVAEFLSWWQENRNNPQMDTLLLQAESL
ncbi:MAG: hypothetical protein HRF51_10010 [bacterium]